MKSTKATESGSSGGTGRGSCQQHANVRKASLTPKPFRIALDIVSYALEDCYDVALIFSQDQDLSEAVEDVKKISTLKDRWIKIACAFPVSPSIPKSRGINGTDWIRIDRTSYDACLDPHDYRPKKVAP